MVLLYCVLTTGVVVGAAEAPAQNAYSQPLVASPPVHFAFSPDTPDPNIVLLLANQTRQAHGSSALVANAKLGELAAARAADMAKRQYFAHKNPDGKYYYDLFADYAIQSDYSCENLDLVSVTDSSQFIQEWLNSTKHRDCMLNPNVTQAGYAVSKFSMVDYNGVVTQAYVVVGIHSTTLR